VRPAAVSASFRHNFVIVSLLPTAGTVLTYLIVSHVQDKLVKTIVANYILWPGAHFINFRFVPSEHRILCASHFDYFGTSMVCNVWQLS
jgi:Mpv17 / PMP22 family